MFLLTNRALQQNWSSEQISLELEVWMSSFLNIRSSRPEVSCKKDIRDVVFDLIKFQAKGLQF